jgi:hypothetical protein
MSKYLIEGEIDFYKELYDSLDVNEDVNEINYKDNNLCLITNKPLIDKFFEMECGHKFNYLPLFFDIKNHKIKYNSMEESFGKLNKSQIRCPYCKNKQNVLLPYYEEFGLEKIDGVNWLNPLLNPKKTHSNSILYKSCDFLSPNFYFDPSGNDPKETSYYNSGNCKFIKCSNVGTILKDDKYYCFNHKKIMVKKYKEEAKKANKEAKQKEKEDKKKANKEAKQKEKEEKKISKKSKIDCLKYNIVNIINDNSGSNIVLGPISISDNTIEIDGCSEIIKSGPNKGNPCGCAIFYTICNDNMCKRHYSLKTKKNKTE